MLHKLCVKFLFVLHIAQSCKMWYNVAIGGDSMEEKKKFNKVAYDNAFIANAYDRINLTIPKGQKEAIKARAESQGESVNAYIWRLIQEDMKKGD